MKQLSWNGNMYIYLSCLYVYKYDVDEKVVWHSFIIVTNNNNTTSISLMSSTVRPFSLNLIFASPRSGMENYTKITHCVNSLKIFFIQALIKGIIIKIKLEFSKPHDAIYNQCVKSIFIY